MTTELLGILAPPSAVLIVDDSVQYAQILSKMLAHGFGFSDITHLSSTELALAQVTAAPQRWRLLFVDYNFPTGFSGVALLQELQSRGLLDQRVVFLVTSAPSPENVKAAVAVGAAGVIAKPFDQRELKRQLENAARRLSTNAGPGF